MEKKSERTNKRNDGKKEQQTWEKEKTQPQKIALKNGQNEYEERQQ